MSNKNLQPNADCKKDTSVVREAGISRYQEGPLKGSSQYDSTVMLEGFQEALNWASTMSRDASLSDTNKFDRCRFSSLCRVSGAIRLFLFTTIAH